MFTYLTYSCAIVAECTETSVAAAASSSLRARARSLSVVVVGPRGEVCRLHAGRLRLRGSAVGAGLRVGVGTFTLHDLTPHAAVWRDKLIATPTATATATTALTVHYRRFTPEEAAREGYTSALTVESSAVTYVHTKRFVAEIVAFFNDFSLLRRVLHEARRKVTVYLYLGIASIQLDERDDRPIRSFDRCKRPSAAERTRARRAARAAAVDVGYGCGSG